MLQRSNHIAIIRLSAMGDVAMTVPVIRALAHQNNDLQITVVSRPFFEPFFANINNVNFFAVDLQNRHKGIFGIFRLFLDLKKLEIDCFADFHNVLRSKIVRKLFWLCGTKTAFTDKGRAEKKRLTKAKNKVFEPIKSMFERHKETLQKLSLDVDLSEPCFAEKSNLSEKIVAISGKKENNNWVGIAPFAQYQSKIYPVDLMQKVVDQLATNPETKIFLFGGGNEEIEFLQTFISNHKNIVVVAGQLPFADELKLISNLDVMLSMDSGNAHIAAMLGTKVITLWGATHPYAGFAPFNQPPENCLVADRNLYPKLPTSVYGNKVVKGYQYAMRTIRVDVVVAAIKATI